MLRNYQNKMMDPLAIPTDAWINVKPITGGTIVLARRVLPGTTIHNKYCEHDAIAIRGEDKEIRIVQLSTFGKLYRKVD